MPMRSLQNSPPGKISLRDKLQYHFDNLMARGGPAILLGLFLMVLFMLILIFGLRIVAGVIFPDETIQKLPDMLWRSVLQIIDAGGIAEDEPANILNKAIGIAAVLLGLIFFSALVAFITNQFTLKFDSLRKGKSRVIERRHTLILGFGAQVIEIIEQLIIANQLKKRPSIVILSQTDKAEMDDILNEAIKDRKNTRIITRSDNIANTGTIRKMSVREASSIIILNNANVIAPPDLRDRGDAGVLESIIAVVAAAGEAHLPPVVAQLHSDKTKRLAENLVPGKIIVIDTNDILARILVATCLNHGLASVYSSLVGLKDNSIYTYRPKSGWMNHPFGKLQFHFNRSVLLGFRTPAGEIRMNPRPDFVPAPEDEGIILAHDRSWIKLFRKQVISPEEQPFFMKKSRIVLEKQLIAGWNSKIHIIIDEYAKSMRDGSTIDILLASPSKDVKSQITAAQDRYKHIKIGLLGRYPRTTEELLHFNLPQYDNILVLAEETGSIEDVDLKTISLLLGLRYALENHAKQTGKVARTQLVTEVIDSSKADVFLKAGANDFLIPHKFISELIAQISQEPDLKVIYDRLFDEEGSDIYVKPVELYFKQIPISVSFADCILAAQNRGEVCIGVKIGAQDNSYQRKFGLYLPPDKNVIFDLGESDSIVTLAENRN